MHSAKAQWRVRDKKRLLAAIIEKLVGDAHISFEGNLRDLELLSLPGASEQETAVLRRNTTSPKLDFVVLPLELLTSQSILSAVGKTVPRSVLHIQVEKSGVLEFGAYDCFHPECVVFGSAVDDALLDSLISQRVLERMR
ncbi:MAG: hypothetical protein ABR921_09625 [Candidatus Sulfotelmatobacter sp.]|jgi:hypothetical protein